MLRVREGTEPGKRRGDRDWRGPRDRGRGCEHHETGLRGGEAPARHPGDGAESRSGPGETGLGCDMGPPTTPGTRSPGAVPPHAAHPPAPTSTMGCWPMLPTRLIIGSRLASGLGASAARPPGHPENRRHPGPGRIHPPAPIPTTNESGFDPWDHRPEATATAWLQQGRPAGVGADGALADCPPTETQGPWAPSSSTFRAPPGLCCTCFKSTPRLHPLCLPPAQASCPILGSSVDPIPTGPSSFLWPPATHPLLGPGARTEPLCLRSQHPAGQAPAEALDLCATRETTDRCGGRELGE